MDSSSLYRSQHITKYISCINIKNIFEFSSLFKSILRHIKEKYDIDYDLNCIDSFTINNHLMRMIGDGDSIKENIVASYKENKKYLNTVKPKLNFLCEFYFFNRLILDKEHKVYIYAEDAEDFEYVGHNMRNFIRDKLNKSEDDFTFIQRESLLKNILDYNSKPQNILNESTMMIFFDNYSCEDLINFTKGRNMFLVTKNISSSNQANIGNFDALIKFICDTNSLNVEDTSLDKRNFMSNQFISKYNNSHLTNDFIFQTIWDNIIRFESELSIKGKIVPGFKRGSKLLGVPTANIEITPDIEAKLKCLLNGVYFGGFSFNSNYNDNKSIDLTKRYKGVLSIGYNPYFDNKTKTLEVFLIDYEGEDFYGEECTLSIQGYIRSESNFDNFEELVTTIAYDIITANGLLVLI